MENAVNLKGRRVILKRGDEYFIYRTEDIAYLFLENKICFLVDLRTEDIHRISGNLHDICELLDPREFYRVNKNYIVSIRSIVALKCCDVNKVELILNPKPRESVFISQLRIRHFKEWIEMENMILSE